MRDQIWAMKIPDQYEEGAWLYTETLDGIPEWPELQSQGFTWEQHLKFNKLVSIEHMKFVLREGIEEEELSEKEQKLARRLIQRAIQEYNNMD